MKKIILPLLILLCMSTTALAAGSATVAILMPPAELSENVQVDFISQETGNTIKSVHLFKSGGYTNTIENVPAGIYKLEAALIGSNGLPYTSDVFKLDIGVETVQIVDDQTTPIIISAEKLPDPSPSPELSPSPTPSPSPSAEPKKKTNIFVDIFLRSWFTILLLIVLLVWAGIRYMQSGGFKD